MTSPGSGIVSLGAWRLDTERQLLHVDGAVTRLQPGVMKLFLLLVKREGEVLSKDDLVEQIWNGRVVSDAALYKRVRTLRKAIADDDGPDRCIIWEYGRGVRFARPSHGLTAPTPTLKPMMGAESPHPDALHTGSLRGFDGAQPIEDWRHLLGTYHLFYRTPSWPDATKVGVSVVKEVDGQAIVHTIEQGHDKADGIRQDARYRGYAEMIDGRIYVFEQNRNPPRTVCLSVLDASHAYRPDIMTGMMMGSSWRWQGAPYTTRVIWRRVPAEITLRQAIRQSGPIQDRSDFEAAIRDSIGNHCLTFQGTINSGSQAARTTNPSPEEQPRITVNPGPSVVAVLPFRSFTADDHFAVFGERLADQIIGKMSKFRDVRVLPSNTSFSVKDLDLTIKDVGGHLNARYVLAGSLRTARGEVQIGSQLIDTISETTIWSENYDVPTELLEDHADRVSSEVMASTVTMVFDHQSQVSKTKNFDDLTHWEHYVLGRSLMFTNDFEAQEQAIRHFERAIDLDAGFVDAVAAISMTLSHQSILDSGQSPITPDHRETEGRKRALRLANQAIEMNEKVPAAWLALSKAQFVLGDVAASMRSARRALSYNPSLGWGHHMVGLGNCQMNLPKDAIKAFDKALDATPQDYYRYSIMAGRALALLLLKKPQEALDCARAAQVKPHKRYLAYVVEICALSQLGQREEAQDVVQRAKGLIQGFGVNLVVHSFLLADDGVRKTIVRELEAAGLK